MTELKKNTGIKFLNRFIRLWGENLDRQSVFIPRFLEPLPPPYFRDVLNKISDNP